MARPSRRQTIIVDDKDKMCTGGNQELSPYVPQTPLGRRLMELHAEIVASGQPLLDWDELEREIAGRRGSVADES